MKDCPITILIFLERVLFLRKPSWKSVELVWLFSNGGFAYKEKFPLFGAEVLQMRKYFMPKAYFSVAKVLLVRKSFALKACLSIAEVLQMRKYFMPKACPIFELQNRSLVGEEGVEPSRTCVHWFLRPTRIPVPPLTLKTKNNCKAWKFYHKSHWK